MSIVAVAKRAGVSVATVSRVINDLNNVRAETAQQVRAAMEEIGYKPPRVKRGPKGGPRRTLPQGFRNGQIAIITLGGFQWWLGLPVMASVVAGVMRAAKESNIQPLLDEMPDPEQLSPMIRRREVDGAIIFFMSGTPESKLVALREYLPLVWVMGGEAGAPEVDHISADNVGIGHLAFRYLVKHKCDHLAFIADRPSLQIMRLRGQSFGNAARDAGLHVSNFLMGATPEEAAAYGGRAHVGATLEELVDRLVAARPRPTGLFVPIDLLTTQVYPLLIARGVQPERDIRIISCDNETERLSSLNPRPASIDLRSEEIGRWAVRQLIQRVQRPDDPAARVQVAPAISLPTYVGQ